MKLALVGGFLGSGKTTAIAAACRQMASRGQRVAVITNDQGDQQVDAELIRSLSIPGHTVSNGCFCCNYDQLDDHIESLARDIGPEIIFAESVGTCTDLVATVARPLAKFRSNLEVVISVFADASFIAAVLEGKSSFEESVRYIYKKQLEEADLLILNKSDLLSLAELKSVDALIRSEYPGREILHLSSLDDGDILRWLSRVHRFTRVARQNLLIDYDLYGSGEAAMAWMDGRLEVHAAHGNAVFVTGRILGSIFQEIQMHHLKIGHLKFFVETAHGKQKVSFTAASSRADAHLAGGETTLAHVLINARVQTDPEALEKLVVEILRKAEKVHGCRIVWDRRRSFKPGYPTPTHRIASEV